MLGCLVGHGLSVPTVVGLDYEYVESHGLYRQLIRHAIVHARQLESRTLHLGMGAGLEKARFGASAHSRCAYLQTGDHYGAEVIAQMSTRTS